MNFIIYANLIWHCGTGVVVNYDYKRIMDGLNSGEIHVDGPNYPWPRPWYYQFPPFNFSHNEPTNP